jgi:hypothetical protein
MMRTEITSRIGKPSGIDDRRLVDSKALRADLGELQ